jgi:hypothetical protein
LFVAGELTHSESPVADTATSSLRGMRAADTLLLVLQCGLLLHLLIAIVNAAPAAATITRLHADVQLVETLPAPFVSTTTAAVQGGDAISAASLQRALTAQPLTRTYELHGLQPHSAYEVRVSWIGTAPYAATVRFLQPEEEEEHEAQNGNNGAVTDAPLLQGGSPPGRRLLDVEKAMFRTDAKGFVIAQPLLANCTDAAVGRGSGARAYRCMHPRVRVEMQWNGVTDRIEVLQRDVVYTIG